MLAHVPSFGRNPRGSPDFLAYPVPKACMHVLGTRVPRRLGVARSASSPKAAQALGCSLTPGLRISFGRVTCMARAASVPGLWALGFLLLACVCGWVRVAFGGGFCLPLPVVAGVLGGCVWARFVVLSLFCRLFVVFVVGLWCRPAFGTCVVSCAFPLPPAVSDWDMIMGYDFMVVNAIGALPHRATLVREDDECLTWLSTDYACGSSQWSAEEEDRIVRAVQAVGAKSRGDRGVQLTEYEMAPQVYDRMIQTLGAEAPETDVFASRDAPLLRKCRRHWHRGDSAWHRHWGLKEWGPMYWHGSLDNTRRTVEKIIADRAKGILVITGIGSTPCLLEGLKSTLDSTPLNEMSFEPEEELFIDAKGVSMPSPGHAWGTKAFLVDGAQAQPTGDEAFIRRVEAVPMKVMFEPKEGTDQPIDGIDVLSHA